MMFRSFALLLVLLLLSACTGAAHLPDPPALPAGWPTDPGAVVFQSFARGGLVGPAGRLSQAPALTLLADGRVIALEQNREPRRYLVGQVPADRLPVLYQQLVEEMGELSGHYEAGTWTDAPITHFTLWLPAGVQRFTVYGFGPEPYEYEQEKAALERIRAAWSALMTGAEEWTPYLSAAATLVVEPREEGDSIPNRQEWPAELVPLPTPAPGEMATSIRVTGEQARDLVQAIPYESYRLYRQGAAYYRVTAVPEIPTYPTS